MTQSEIKYSLMTDFVEDLLLWTMWPAEPIFISHLRIFKVTEWTLLAFSSSKCLNDSQEIANISIPWMAMPSTLHMSCTCHIQCTYTMGMPENGYSFRNYQCNTNRYSIYLSFHFGLYPDFALEPLAWRLCWPQCFHDTTVSTKHGQNRNDKEHQRHERPVRYPRRPIVQRVIGGTDVILHERPFSVTPALCMVRPMALVNVPDVQKWRPHNDGH